MIKKVTLILCVLILSQILNYTVFIKDKRNSNLKEINFPTAMNKVTTELIFTDIRRLEGLANHFEVKRVYGVSKLKFTIDRYYLVSYLFIRVQMDTKQVPNGMSNEKGCFS